MYRALVRAAVVSVALLATGCPAGKSKKARDPIPPDEDGSRLWLRYQQVSRADRLAEYRAALTHVVRAGSSATLQAAQSELVSGLGGLLGAAVPVADQPMGNGAVVLGTPASSAIVRGLALGSRLTAVG
ncbi:MAG TPA: alpha-glucuronidase family glycosyl hydrolase, partial [Polyangia bacterium]